MPMALKRQTFEILMNACPFLHADVQRLCLYCQQSSILSVQGLLEMAVPTLALTLCIICATHVHHLYHFFQENL